MSDSIQNVASIILGDPTVTSTFTVVSNGTTTVTTDTTVNLAAADFGVVNYTTTSPTTGTIAAGATGLETDYAQTTGGQGATNAGFQNFEFLAAQTIVTNGVTAVTNIASLAAAGQLEFAEQLKANLNSNPPVEATFNTVTIQSFDANNMVFASSTGTDFLLQDGGVNPVKTHFTAITDLAATGATFNAPNALVCFAEGTRIRTEQGEVAVEDLAEGDRVSVLDNAGAASRPVVWIGYRDVNLAAAPEPAKVQPIRIRRDAFGKDMPCRDLLVSPSHGVFTGGALVPARLLINGATIVRETRLPRVRYLHVELDRHAILFSEGLPSESYLDTGNRSFFQNGGAVVDLNAGFAGFERSPTRDANSCVPFLTAPDDVRPLWERLADRAAALGYRLPEIETTTDPAPSLTIGGRTIRPIRATEGRYCFMLPANAQEIRLLTRAARLCDTSPWIEDDRMLGVSVSRVRLHHGAAIEDLALDGPAPGEGWWQIEQDGNRIWRWTDGDAALRLPEAEGSARVLEITMGGGMRYPLEAADIQHANVRHANVYHDREAIARIA